MQDQLPHNTGGCSRADDGHEVDGAENLVDARIACQKACQSQRHQQLCRHLDDGPLDGNHQAVIKPAVAEHFTEVVQSDEGIGGERNVRIIQTHDKAHAQRINVEHQKKNNDRRNEQIGHVGVAERPALYRF